MAGHLLRAIAAALLLGTAACGTVPDCGLHGASMLMATLYFGRDVADRPPVSDRDWLNFLDTEVTPRFPAGFTVTDGNGQWYDGEQHTIVRESSKLLLIIVPRSAVSLGQLDAIADAYKQRFHQQAVGKTLVQSCAAF
jgi:hypothetical protein